MSSVSLPEVWLRGPLPQFIPMLQPVAHALLQAQEEVNQLMKEVPASLLWKKPGGAASAGFHLQHMTGVLDRLFTYARGEGVTVAQLAYLKAEGDPVADAVPAQLLARFNHQVSLSLEALQHCTTDSLFEYRAVGRNQLPSTVIGLFFHAAEHTMRHLGQLLVTVKVAG